MFIINGTCPIHTVHLSKVWDGINAEYWQSAHKELLFACQSCLHIYAYLEINEMLTVSKICNLFQSSLGYCTVRFLYPK